MLDGQEVGALDAGVVVIVEFVEDVDLVAGLEEALDEVGADEAGAAGDEEGLFTRGPTGVKSSKFEIRNSKDLARGARRLFNWNVR